MLSHQQSHRLRLPPSIVRMMDQGHSPESIRAAAKREKARRGLDAFIEQGWPLVEPKRPFVSNWHIQAVTSHLEAVSRWEIKRLLILVPPGTMKSLSVSVFWPAWDWGPNNNPHHRFIFTSYAKHLSLRDSVRTRRIIRSPWYQSMWGNRFNLVDDRDTMSVFYNNHTGFRLATSVDGIATGERGDIVVADDPHNVKEAESDKKRNSVLDWWDESMSTRVNDPDDSAFVIVMQRIHQNDLAGHVIRQGGYEVLQLPMEYEPTTRCFTSLQPKGYTGPKRKRYSHDPRRREGELLFPKRITAKHVADLKVRLGSYAAAAQLQMRPSPRGGGMIKLAWFQRYRQPPGKNKIMRIVQSWDTASKDGLENAYSVCGTWAQCADGHYLLHVLRRRMNTPTLQKTAPMHYKAWNADAVVIEDKASGTGLIQHMRQPVQGQLPYNVFEMLPDKDKVARMDDETPTVEAGNVWLPEEADWLSDFEGELESFPNSAMKDQADMFSQYLKWVRKHTMEQDWGIY